MAELITLARPYARAAFDFARDAGDLRGWSEQLRLTAAVARTDTVAGVLKHPAWSAERQAGLLREVCGDRLNTAVENFIKLLASNRRLPLLPEIASLFEQFKTNLEKRVEVTVLSAFEMDDSTRETLAQAVTGKLNREVIVDTQTDADLLGGVLIRAGDLVIDGSVRGRLRKLSAAMNSQD